MMPALLIRMCSGPCQPAVNARTDSRSATSRRATWIASFPVALRRSAATCSPASGRRTASVTSAPLAARARAVSTPMPEPAPVTIARLPDRSTPSITSEAVLSRPNGVVKSWDM